MARQDDGHRPGETIRKRSTRTFIIAAIVLVVIVLAFILIGQVTAIP